MSCSLSLTNKMQYLCYLSSATLSVVEKIEKAQNIQE